MNAELLKQLSTALGAQIRAYYHVRENPRLRPVNLVGTRSTASPSLQPEVWDAGGTRPYRVQREVELFPLPRGEGQGEGKAAPQQSKLFRKPESLPS